MHSIRLPASVESLDDVSKFVAEISSECELSQESAYRLRLASEEIFTNIATHGYEDIPDGERLRAEACVVLEGGKDNNQIWLRFRDTAKPFDPTRAADPGGLSKDLSERPIGGLGIYLVRKSMDAFEYQREHDENVLTIGMACAE